MDDTIICHNCGALVDDPEMQELEYETREGRIFYFCSPWCVRDYSEEFGITDWM